MKSVFNSIAIVAIISVAGCAQVPLTPEGKNIKVVTSPPEGCEVLDLFSQSSMNGQNSGEKYISARNIAANKAAKEGATHMRIIDQDGNNTDSGARRQVAVETYRCPVR